MKPKIKRPWKFGAGPVKPMINLRIKRKDFEKAFNTFSYQRPHTYLDTEDGSIFSVSRRSDSRLHRTYWSIVSAAEHGARIEALMQSDPREFVRLWDTGRVGFAFATREQMEAQIKIVYAAEPKEIDRLLQAAAVKFDDEGRYREIPGRDWHDDFDDMAEFVAQYEGKRAYKVLEPTIYWTSGFDNFTKALESFPEIKDAWNLWFAEALKKRALGWFRREGIEPEFY